MVTIELAIPRGATVYRWMHRHQWHAVAQIRTTTAPLTVRVAVPAGSIIEERRGHRRRWFLVLASGALRLVARNDDRDSVRRLMTYLQIRRRLDRHMVAVCLVQATLKRRMARLRRLYEKALGTWTTAISLPA